jgi:hypothetical protein
MFITDAVILHGARTSMMRRGIAPASIGGRQGIAIVIESIS